MRILVVEDDPVVAMDIGSILSDAGYVVVGPVSSVVAAVDLAQSTALDLALIDVDLGAGGNGATLAPVLLLRWNIPSIFVTAFLSDQEPSDSMSVAVLGKPFTPDMLLESVRAVQRALSAALALDRTVH